MARHLYCLRCPPIFLVFSSLCFAGNRAAFLLLRQKENTNFQTGARTSLCSPHTKLLAESSKEEQSVFEAFEQSVTQRIEKSQQFDDERGLMHDSRRSASFISLDAVQKASQQNVDHCKVIAQKLRGNGGYVIVDLGNSSETKEFDILTDMWSNCIQNIPFPADNNSKKYAESSPWIRRQILARKHQEEKQETGYHYIETAVRRRDAALSLAGDDVADYVATLLSEDGVAAAKQSFELLLDVATKMVYLTLISCERNSTATKTLVERVIDNGKRSNESFGEEDTPWSCSVHRLCRYASNECDCEAVESLRSHTDWTLVTLVPVSTVSGLEVWNPMENVWIRPEEAARKQCDSSCNSWNSRYVVVMAGKWLEILTSGKIQAAVHRVVVASQNQPNPRMSAPFFLRPRNRVGEHLRQHFGNETKLETFHMSAAGYMNRFLWDAYS